MSKSLFKEDRERAKPAKAKRRPSLDEKNSAKKPAPTAVIGQFAATSKALPENAEKKQFVKPSRPVSVSQFREKPCDNSTEMQPPHGAGKFRTFDLKIINFLEL